MRPESTASEEKEDQIRRRAYQLWIEEGQPHGRQQAHWEKARQDIEDEETEGKSRVGREVPAGPSAADPLATIIDPPMKTKTAARKKPSFKSAKA